MSGVFDFCFWRAYQVLGVPAFAFFEGLVIENARNRELIVRLCL